MNANGRINVNSKKASMIYSDQTGLAQKVIGNEIAPGKHCNDRQTIDRLTDRPIDQQTDR